MCKQDDFSSINKDYSMNIDEKTCVNHCKNRKEKKIPSKKQSTKEADLNCPKSRPEIQGMTFIVSLHLLNHTTGQGGYGPINNYVFMKAFYI